MQVLNKAFHPIPKSTVSLAVTSTTGNIAMPSIAQHATAIRVVFTAGTAAARINPGKGSGTVATSTDMLLPNPGTPFVYAECFGIDGATDTFIAAKTDAGTCTIEVTFGFAA